MKVIEVKNLKKYFGKTKAIDDVSFSVEKGEIFGFLGPNGAGKTTAIRCMMDFLRPDAGSIILFRKDAQKDSVILKKKIGYLSGQIKLYDKWTGQQHINFVKHLNGKADYSQKLISRLDFDSSVRTKKLSSGNRQKLGIIMAFMCEPELFIFDEPTNALDPLLQNEVYKLIDEAADKGATIFMSSHNLAEVDKVCDRVGIIKQGKIVTTENIQNLKQMRLHAVHVNFKEKINREDLISENIQVIEELGNELKLTVKGDPNELIQKLSKYKVQELEISHASLEEIFLEFYQE
jgi:ABC-2 type transport system ATP-binding protein